MANTDLFPPIFNTFLACLHAEQPVDHSRLAQLSPAEWEELVALAFKQNIAPMLYHRLKIQGVLNFVPPALQQRLQAKLQSTTNNNLRRLAEFKRLVSAFTEAGIPVLALKGIHLASTVYSQIGQRQMGDLDLLVPIPDAIRAAKIAQSLGYMLSRNLADVEREFWVAHHLPQMVNADGLHLEIHGNLVLPQEFYTVNAPVWWQGAVETEIAGERVKVLSPVNLMLHLCIHISFHHQFKADLRHYYDLVALTMFLGNQLDWAEVVRRTEERGWAKGIGLTLYLAQQLFGLPLPSAVSALISQPDFEPMAQIAMLEMLQNNDFFPGKGLFSKDVAQFQYQKGIPGQIGYIIQRIFIPKEIMAKKYPVRADSIWVYPYYLVRAKNLIRDHADTVLRMSRGDEKTVASAECKHRLWQWLTKV